MASIMNRMITRSVRQIPRRTMAGSVEAAEADTKQWINISIGALGAVGVTTLWVLYVESQHEHGHHENPRAYKKIRTKPYPWACPDCNFFDSKCFAECKAAKK